MTARPSRPGQRRPSADRKSRSLSDRAFRSTAALAALAVGLLLVAIGLLLVWNSREADLAEVRPRVHHRDDVGPGRGDLRRAAVHRRDDLLVGVSRSSSPHPIGLLTAIFLAELAPRRVAIPLTFLIELLAAIPSVVFGLWGVFVLGPFLRSTVEPWIVRVARLDPDLRRAVVRHRAVRAPGSSSRS